MFSAFRASLLASLGLALGVTGMACGSRHARSGPGGRKIAESCESPKPILQKSGADSGFVQCADGSIDRVKAVRCELALTDTCLGTEREKSCTSAADCKERPNGKCQSYFMAPDPGKACSCAYECTTDADCGPDSICACAGVGKQASSTCISAKACKTNADCGSGECGLSEYNNGCYWQEDLICRSSSDVCRTGADCETGQCGVPDGKAPSCQTQGCTVGRPLVAQGAWLSAPPARRADWTVVLEPETASLSAELRAALADHFLKMAAMEHASVGSFARFSLELLAIAAPPSLLSATHEAAADEIRHAQMAYSLAAAYSGAPVGPGRLPVSRVAPATDEEAIVRALVEEACVGETVAAAEARVIATMVTDPALVKVHARIAEDESRHAELGWRCLAWMLERSPHLSPVVVEAFERAERAIVARADGEPSGAATPESPGHGLLSEAALASLRSQAVREIVVVCREALFAGTAVPVGARVAPLSRLSC